MGLDRVLTPGKLGIVLWGDPVLSKVCDNVEDNEFGPELELFAGQLLATMAAHDGLGLAAPQVGVSKRIFAMMLPDQKEPRPIVVCNPVLDLRGDTTYEVEGCLSMPGIFIQIERSENATLQYQDPTGKFFELPLITPWDARVAQHEFDHINGIFFTTRVSRQVRRQALKDWAREKEKRGIKE